ncbi:hypothetical protein [Bradyrhizobium sp. 2TAF24]|uniref:hypothetical protein n=1 Tax=Bradyrhizobium sp. 2TAF24 TaxID=3233011 RepID=UPI003F8EE359
MLARLIAGSLVAASVVVPAIAEEMTPEQARQFVANKLFSFTCFDGSKGSGRIYSDGSVAGSIQFGGSGPVRYARLPVNTIQVRPNSVCASLKGLPFEPCFNLTKNDEASFRGSVSGMGFAYCEFHKHGNSMIMARAQIRPRRLHPTEPTRSADATPRAEVQAEPVKAEPALELRRSTE